MEMPTSDGSLSEGLISYLIRERGSAPQCAPEKHLSRLKQDVANTKMELKATLKEAQLASCSVELLLPLFKNTVEGISLENANLSASSLKKIFEQNDILSKELDTFNRVKLALEHLIKQTDYEQIGDSLLCLLKDLSDNESENRNLEEKVLEKETYIRELSCLFQNEKESALKANRLSQSVKVVHDRLQRQIQKREAENEKLKEHVQSLETQIAKWNLQVKMNKQEAVAIKEASRQKAVALKKASKVYRQRLRHFTGDIERLASQVRDQVDGNQSLLTKLSLEEENHLIQLKCENLKEKLEQMDAENKELEKKLADQEECLKHSDLELKEKAAEYTALSRQLEAALEEGRQKVSEEVEKMSSRERALQIKILDLEAELRKKNEEQNQLVDKMNTKTQHQAICLKEIQHSLEKSETRNESIKNYLQFLQISYVTMFR